MHGVKLSWTATTNIGLSPYAYGIYGRTAGAEHAIVDVRPEVGAGDIDGGVLPAATSSAAQPADVKAAAGPEG